MNWKKMLSLAKFPTQIHYNCLQHNNISQNLNFNSKSYLNFNAVIKKLRIRLCCKASKKGGFSLKEAGKFEDDFDDEFLDIEDDGEFDDDEEGDFVIPLKSMKKWVENKPRGFGEGKVYDTSVEDELMEEIEQSRAAQIANINKLKNGPEGTSSKKDKGPMPTHDGFRVRLVNLPKKKNIHKDLRLNFKEVAGIVNIVPVVSGNEKTRDPVCKGIAFVDFKQQDAAQRFIENFTGKNISFGKVQKQIKCEMVNSKLPNPVTDKSTEPSQRSMLKSHEGLDFVVESLADAIPSNLSEESRTSEVESEDERHTSVEEVSSIDDSSIKRGKFNLSAESTTSEVERLISVEEVSSKDDSSSKNAKKSKTNEKKTAPKRRKDKNPQLNIPGSAKKLKSKDKALLSGVFSKYGANSISTVKESSR